MHNSEIQQALAAIYHRLTPKDYQAIATRLNISVDETRKRLKTFHDRTPEAAGWFDVYVDGDEIPLPTNARAISIATYNRLIGLPKIQGLVQRPSRLTEALFVFNQRAVNFNLYVDGLRTPGDFDGLFTQSISLDYGHLAELLIRSGLTEYSFCDRCDAIWKPSPSHPGNICTKCESHIMTFA